MAAAAILDFERLKIYLPVPHGGPMCIAMLYFIEIGEAVGKKSRQCHKTHALSHLHNLALAFPDYNVAFVIFFAVLELGLIQHYISCEQILLRGKCHVSVSVCVSVWVYLSHAGIVPIRL